MPKPPVPPPAPADANTTTSSTKLRTYRGQIIAFLEERDAFGSREWFNDDPGWRADLRNLPRFHERGWTVAESLRHALPDITALLLYAIVLFVLTNRLFARYDP